jgi:hypothetical protein
MSDKDKAAPPASQPTTPEPSEQEYRMRRALARLREQLRGPFKAEDLARLTEIQPRTRQPEMLEMLRQGMPPTHHRTKPRSVCGRPKATGWNGWCRSRILLVRIGRTNSLISRSLHNITVSTSNRCARLFSITNSNRGQCSIRRQSSHSPIRRQSSRSSSHRHRSRNSIRRPNNRHQNRNRSRSRNQHSRRRRVVIRLSQPMKSSAWLRLLKPNIRA